MSASIPQEKLGREVLEAPPGKVRESYSRLVGTDSQVPAGEPGMVERRRCEGGIHQQVEETNSVAGRRLHCVVCGRSWAVQSSSGGWGVS